jgi:uncharacterized membrane protein (DUF4010 family)
VIPLVLAHGALGAFDEILFLAVAVVFVGLMIVAWIRSRNNADEAETGAITDTETRAAEGQSPSDARPDHFPLT